ncbi:ABC-type sugar transport system, substrate-binding protein, contains N-terminal xre family HTH domain [Pustulibacterium marinum]|uniref:histidine kinase n=1 Tax=Pustulibacterium marinum TaxID=1224947 RepID=A0A1I7GDB6_9FLAO|nr:substrate-binding domain-containing protein [Pustulibacterium marinum]SFU46444.1 ABC-type sugar transport system, substrate-binding protein, contains N-terminal xre family HTH domain [Pustulibacterium marinum]
MKLFRILYTITIFCFLWCFISCDTNDDEKKIKIGFSQAMTTDDWRLQMNYTMKVEASLHPEVDLEILDAENDVDKQINDIETFIKKGIDVLIVSPIASKPLTAVVKKAKEHGIPVIAIDRKTEGEFFDAYVGADNITVGREAAAYAGTHQTGTGKIIELTGLKSSSPAQERSLGFLQGLTKYPKLQLVKSIEGDWEKESITESFKNYLKNHDDIEFVFAHNDRMAYGAWQEARKLGVEDKLKFIGVDGLNTPDGGVALVQKGVLQASILYPTGGNDALQLALDLVNEIPVENHKMLNTIVVNNINANILKHQMDRVDQQQGIIETQQSFLKEQQEKYTSLNMLLKILLALLIVIFGLAVYSIYSGISIARKRKELENTNKTVIAQRDEIKKIANELRETHEARLNFFTGISHEFKTPLTLIMSYTESLLHQLENNKKLENNELKLIYNNSNRLKRLIDQLLDFRKIEDQRFAIKVREVNIYDFLKGVIAYFKPEAARRNINIDFKSRKKHVPLFIDTELMDKVFFNLLSNGLKFTPNNGTIKIRIIENENNTVEITVSDSGIGIPNEEIQHIFEPFYQASNNSRPSSGIGLYVAKQFVELHSGTITATSSKGTIFSIFLKQGTDHFSEDDVQASGDLDKETVFNPLLPVEINTVSSKENDALENSILIIEDNPELIQFLRGKLQNSFQIFTSDGSDATDIATTQIPDMIICDINLVEKDGFTISKTLKSDLRTSHIPIVMLTALSDEYSRIKGLESGVDLYITKPFSFDVLLQSIQNVLYNRERLRFHYTNSIDEITPEKFHQPEQNFLLKLNEIIETEMTDAQFTVEKLADKMNISRVQLYRKVKAILGVSVSEHINEVRLQKAKLLLQDGKLSISEIAYSVGFSSPNYFSTLFKNKFKISPSDYKSN